MREAVVRVAGLAIGLGRESSDSTHVLWYPLPIHCHIIDNR